jgi:hypothetical protein
MLGDSKFRHDGRGRSETAQDHSLGGNPGRLPAEAIAATNNLELVDNKNA